VKDAYPGGVHIHYTIAQAVLREPRDRYRSNPAAFPHEGCMAQGLIGLSRGTAVL